jgi:plasmid stability protein
MPSGIFVENVPDDIFEKLGARARLHNRSLQEELMSILEEAVGPHALSLEEIELQLSGLKFKTGADSTAWIKELRDAN